MSEQVFFSAPWDHKLRILTLVFSLVLLGVAVATIIMTVKLSTTPMARVVLLTSSLLSLVALVLSAALGPRGYTIGPESLRVERRLRPVVIPLSTIEGVETLPGDRLRVSIRTLGSEGLFGYYGRFRNAALGSYRMYATRSQGFVLIRGKVPYVITPEDPERFISTLNEQRGGMARR